jgi:hypothetical protein
MASLRGRYFSARDINFINSINAELMGDIIETIVTVFKIAASETRVNLYGESAPSEGKTFYPGIDISSLIDRADITGEDDGFGPDRDQDVVFKFREKMCQQVNFFPQIGDIISAGYGSTSSVKTDGTLWTWGSNASGQIGDNTVVSRSSPVQVGALTNWFRVVAGSGTTSTLGFNLAITRG